MKGSVGRQLSMVFCFYTHLQNESLDDLYSDLFKDVCPASSEQLYKLLSNSSSIEIENSCILLD